MQCPYYVLKALQHALAREEPLVRVIQTPTGGGFGGKEEFPSHIALHAALLAIKGGRPVKLIYDRGETWRDHQAPPALVRHRTGLMRDGRLLAGDGSRTHRRRSPPRVLGQEPAVAHEARCGAAPARGGACGRRHSSPRS